MVQIPKVGEVLLSPVMRGHNVAEPKYAHSKSSMKRTSSIILLLCGVVSPLFPTEHATRLSDARSAVEANLKTSEGKAYEQQLGKEWMEKYPGTVRQCKQNARNDREPFWILLRLAKDGAVREVLLHPETKVGACIRGTLIKDRFSPPPHPDHWVSIYLKLSK